MSNAKQETIADIVAEMRKDIAEGTVGIWSDFGGEIARSYADRIEAAMRHQFREVTKMIPHEEVAVSKMETTNQTREKSSAVGNAAEMREALLETKSVIARCMEILNKIPGGVPYDGLIDDVADEICDLRESYVNPALSDPPRNCDVGTAEEQYARVLAFCKRHKVGFRCVDCPVNGVLAKNCALIWAQMPYEEGGAE